MSSFDPSSLPPCCYVCGEAGHVSSDCPGTHLQPSFPGEERCHYCGLYGHNQSVCPQLLPPPSSTYHSIPTSPSHHSIPYCTNCDGYGHSHSPCPVKPTPLEVQTTSLIADTKKMTEGFTTLFQLYTESKAECQSHLSTISDLEQQLHTSQTLVGSLSSTNTELEASLTAIPQSSSVDADRLQFLEDQLRSHKSTISDLEQQLQTSTAKVENLSRQVVNLKEKLKTPWDKARRLQVDLDNREKSFLDLYSQFKTLQSEHEKLQLVSSTHHSQSNPLQSTVVELTTEITRLQALVDTHSSIPPISPFEPLVESLTF